MSLDPPVYITSLQNNIRGRILSWDGAVRARTITDADLKKIKSIDKVRSEQRKQTIEADPNSFKSLFLGDGESPSIFQTATKREDIIQYLLVLTGDLINSVPSFSTILIDHPDPYKPFASFLTHSSNPEDAIPLLTSAVLSSLIAHALATLPKTSQTLEDAILKLNKYFSSLAKSSDSGLQDIAVQGYSAILIRKKSRAIFWDQREDTLIPLVAILRSATGGASNQDSSSWSVVSSSRTLVSDPGLSGGVSIQLLYHVLLVFWQLSFEGDVVGSDLDEEHDIVPLLANLLRVSPKEKISRLILSTLYNLLSTNKSTLLPAAGQARLPALLKNIKGRHLTDEDLLEDLSNLTSMLEEFSKSQTNFDEYAQEVQSGHLRWTPAHRNSTFWRENAQRIVEYNKGELLKKLADILSKKWDGDKQVLAIGCNDVAYLVKEVPEKKSQLEKLGLKARVMELMQADDEAVRWESLRAVGEWLRYSFNQ